MKHRFLGSVFSVGMVFCAASLLSAQTIQVNQNNRTIAVNVSDAAKADADMATVHIGFEVYAPDAGLNAQVLQATPHHSRHI